MAWVQATRSAAAIPLGAFADLLPADVRSDDLLELMRRSAAALRGRADGRRIVIGVDDGHSLDPTSAALVLQLASTRVAFVVVTVRSGDAAPDAITSLWKDVGRAAPDAAAARRGRDDRPRRAGARRHRWSRARSRWIVDEQPGQRAVRARAPARRASRAATSCPTAGSGASSAIRRCASRSATSSTRGWPASTRPSATRSSCWRSASRCRSRSSSSSPAPSRWPPPRRGGS